MNIPTIEEDQLETCIDKNQSLLVIDIWMDDCPPCNMLAPKLKAVAQDYEGKIEIYKVKVTEDSSLMDQFDIEAVPTLLFFNNGEVISRLEGMVHSNELDHQFENLIRRKN